MYSSNHQIVVETNIGSIEKKKNMLKMAAIPIIQAVLS